MAEDFQLNVLKLICAELYFSVVMTASREMFGKSYFSLGVSEKATLEQAVWSHISGNLSGITPALFAPPTPAPTANPQEKKNGHAN